MLQPLHSSRKTGSRRGLVLSGLQPEAGSRHPDGSVDSAGRSDHQPQTFSTEQSVSFDVQQTVDGRRISSRGFRHDAEHDASEQQQRQRGERDASCDSNRRNGLREHSRNLERPQNVEHFVSIVAQVTTSLKSSASHASATSSRHDHLVQQQHLRPLRGLQPSRVGPSERSLHCDV
jgi:hypothetical protein